MQGLGWCVPRSKASCHAPFHNWNRCKITKIFETQHIFCKKIRITIVSLKSFVIFNRLFVYTFALIT